MSYCQIPREGSPSSFKCPITSFVSCHRVPHGDPGSGQTRLHLLQPFFLASTYLALFACSSPWPALMLLCRQSNMIISSQHDTSISATDIPLLTPVSHEMTPLWVLVANGFIGHRLLLSITICRYLQMFTICPLTPLACFLFSCSPPSSSQFSSCTLFLVPCCTVTAD
jgi:hypothetical protein